jgi:pimeloyl-ACP methyl ester carboxylesterase
MRHPPFSPLRSAPKAASRPSRQKQFPSRKNLPRHPRPIENEMNMKPKQFAHISWVALLLAPALLLGQVREVRITSSVDGSEQPAIFFAPKTKNVPVPLLVTLHSWSADYRQKLHKSMEDHCVKNGWAYVHPNFRGPNQNPKATGSDLAVQDVLDAVAYAKKQTKVDEKRILLIGTSGGGYMSLLMAGRAPRLWAGVSAWVPISDLAAWHAECKAKGSKYAREIELSCGGAPRASDKVDEEYRKRSPLTYLSIAKGIVNLDINAGIQDGHSGSVPVSHSLHAFNAVAEEKDEISQALIDELVQTAKAPDSHAFSGKDISYGKKQPLFRRASSKARVTLFDGGHELVASAALAWLIKSSK